MKAYSYQNFDGRYNYNKYNEKYDTNVTQTDNNSEVLFILDGSGSMNGKIGFSPKLFHAIDAIRNILNESGDTAKIGLRIFGYNMNDSNLLYPNRKYSRPDIVELCRESSLVLPIARYNSSNISDRLSNIKANGQSPIGYSLRQAVQNDFSPNSPLKHIILITDGGENCGDDPCLYIKKLMQLRDDIKIDVIGITVDDNAYSQLNCIAQAGKGNFYSIDNADDFKLKFKQAFNSNIKTIVPDNVSPDINKISFPKNINNGTIYKNYALQFD